ncbi:hypothetical protein EJD97_005591 [Solanum chilense]|uniref:Tetraspanin-8-like n=1 Tax=Solanum chilense TaxID=4083 RepID=A0A6N2CIL6_SOLCI|nr:hypothetical protein EJD97_005591 [Solanum chilense]
MFRCSNCFITLLNFITLVAAAMLILMSMSFGNNTNQTTCQKVVQQPMMILGVVLLIISLMGIVGAACHVSFLLWIYLFMLFCIITGMIIYSLFNLFFTLSHLENKGHEKSDHQKSDWEDKFQEYSQWMKNAVPDEKQWDKIRSCMIDAKMCKYIPADRTEDYYKTKLLKIQSGCCIPPAYCHFQFQNASTWIVPKGGAVDGDADCKAWSNEPNLMCYNCNACKKSTFDSIKESSAHTSLISLIIFIILSIIYSIGCCALTNNSYRERAYGYNGYRPYGYP